VSRPQPVVTVHPGLLAGPYRDVVAHLGGQLLDLGHTGLNPFHPGGLSAGEPNPVGDSR